jgi:uncharacterized membrane protein YkvA (DUF1232 family)
MSNPVKRPGNRAPRWLVVRFVKVGPQRIAAFRALWRAISRARRPGAPDVAERVRALPRMARDAVTGAYPQLSRARIGLIVLALAYLVSPVDLVPEVLVPLLGLGDDALVALWLGGAFLAETDRFLAWERERSAVADLPPA